MNKLVERKMFKFCLDGDNLDKAIRKSLFDKETSDRVIVLNNNRRIPIHSLILSLRSSVLNRIIFSSNNIYRYEININDEDEESFLQMIRFCYTDDVISEKYLVNLIILGHRYKVIFMANYCELLYNKLSMKKKIIALRYFCASRIISNTNNRLIDYIIFANIVSKSILDDDDDLNQALGNYKLNLYDNLQKKKLNNNDNNNNNNENNNNNDNTVIENNKSDSNSNSNSNGNSNGNNNISGSVYK